MTEPSIVLKFRSTSVEGAGAFARVAEMVRVSLGASRANLTLVVEEARVRDAVMRLHYAFFGATAPAAA